MTSVDTISCGENVLYKHKGGYPLASKQVLKPFTIHSSHMPLYECRVVNRTVPVMFKVGNRAGSGSVNRSSFLLRGSLRGKAVCSMTIRNGYLVLINSSRGKIQQKMKYHWSHLYNIEFPIQSTSQTFILTFYQGTDKAFKEDKANFSVSYELVSIRITVLDDDPVIGDIYEIVRGQATIISESALLLERNGEEGMKRAETFLRLSVDLYTLVHSGAHPQTIESINKLISLMEKMNGSSKFSEIMFWKERVEKLEKDLEGHSSRGELVNGVCL